MNVHIRSRINIFAYLLQVAGRHRFSRVKSSVIIDRRGRERGISVSIANRFERGHVVIGSASFCDSCRGIFSADMLPAALMSLAFRVMRAGLPRCPSACHDF